MKKSHFSETQIISILKQADAGIKVEELCRQHGISNATYAWKSKYRACKYQILNGCGF
jgi:putative transposase